LLLLGAALCASAQAPSQAPSKSQGPDRNAAVTTLTIFAGTARGLYRSRDWGTTFEAVVGRSPGDHLGATGGVSCILPLGPQVLMGADAGVYFSPDFGETWKQIAAKGPCGVLLGSRYPLADKTLFLGTPAGLLRSTLEVFEPDDTPRTFGATPLDGGVLRLDWPGPQLFAGTTQGLFVSLDSASTFGRVGASGPAPLPAGDVTALAVSAFYSADPALMAAVGTEGVFRTGDGGQKWSQAGLKGRRVNDLFWLGPFLYAATDTGVFRTEDLGYNWVALSDGLEGRAALRLLFPLAPTSGAEAFVGTDRGIYWTGDGGMHWRAIGGTLAGDAVRVLATFPQPDPVQKKRR
jgi:photosystem II stability/assembly factor-like uncharacterized protein